MAIDRAAIAIFDTHSDAEAAVKELQHSGFDMKKLSIVGKDYRTEEHPIGFYNTGDRMKYWGKLGAFWGGFWGILFGSGFFLIPGIGHVMVLGPMVGWVVGALESAAVMGGLSAIGAALISLGIPKDSVVNYETHIKAGKFMVVAHGATADVQKASSILERSRPVMAGTH